MGNYKKDFILFIPIIDELKEKYNFQGLWHFTDLSNLESIFKSGELSSRVQCKENGIQFLDGANHDVTDGTRRSVRNCTRFYYRPQTPTLYDNEGIKPIIYSSKVHIPRPVYLLFSEELIYDEDTEFSNGNAKNSDIEDTVEFFKSMDWETIFHNTWFTTAERDYIVNKRHAELLSRKPVNLRYVKKIIFRSKADLSQAIRIWGEDSRFIVDKTCFSDKSRLFPTDWRYNNYITSYNFQYLSNILKLELYLEKPIGDYTVSWYIEDNKGNNKTCFVKETLDDFDNLDDISKFFKELMNRVDINLTFNYSPSDKDVIKIYLNGVLSIVETIRTK